MIGWIVKCSGHVKYLVGSLSKHGACADGIGNACESMIDMVALLIVLVNAYSRAISDLVVHSIDLSEAAMNLLEQTSLRLHQSDTSPAIIFAHPIATAQSRRENDIS